jgi:LysR family glycine cleavage system transcriptional activator
MLQTPMRGLRSFCIAAKCLSFKHAASQLFLTPSAVSHQIKQLEQQLGFELFVRKTRSLELTQQGELFYHAVQPHLDNLAQTVERFVHKQHNQTIVIAMPEFLASEVFIPKLSSWTQNHPEINIQVETAKLGEQTDRPADLSIVLTSGKPSDGIVDELFPIRYIPACNQQLHQKYSEMGYAALDQVPLILHKSRPWLWHQWAQKEGIAEFEPGQILQFDSMFGVARAAQQGMGVALVPLPMSQVWFDEGLLMPLFNNEMVTRDCYYLVQHHKDTQGKPLNVFANWVKSALMGLK